MKKILITIITIIVASVPGWTQVYNDYSASWNYADFLFGSPNGGGSVSVDLTSDVFTVTFGASFSSATMAQGNIKQLLVTPSLPSGEIELGEITSGYHASINNGYLKISYQGSGSAPSITGFNKTLTYDFNDYNYVRVLTPRIETSNSGDVVLGATKENVIVQTTFFDGLGRQIQSVAKEASPGGNDVIAVAQYDQYGRMPNEYLPYTDGDNGTFKSDWSTKISGFYNQSNDNIANSSIYFASKSFEASPTGFVKKASSPGTAIVSTNIMEFGYRLNEVGVNGDGIRKFSVSNDANQTITSSAYSANELTVSTSSDENQNIVLEFTDADGQLVCKKVQKDATSYVSTYYLYDVFDQLVFVIQPQGIEEIISNSNDWSLLNDQTFRNQWLFQYKYDHRRRMVEKQVPGAGRVFMVYDERDRLILTQDANQRKQSTVTISGDQTVDQYEGVSYVIEDGGTLTLDVGFEFSASDAIEFTAGFDGDNIEGQWTFTKYDELNRPVVTGHVNINGSRQDVQQQVDNFFVTGDFYESYSTNGALEGYSNTSFPTQHESGTAIASSDLLTVTYYDNYEFNSASGAPSGYLVKPEGQITGSRIKILGSSNFLETVSYYDDRGRVLKTVGDNHLGGSDTNTLEYFNDVRASVKKSTTVHIANSNSLTQVEEYTYDHGERLLKTTHKIGSQATVTLAENDYNEIGELIEKNVGKVGSGSFAQSIDYEYTIRGWLSKINGGTSFDDPDSDKFGMHLEYETAGQYNGNIGRITWKTLGGNGNNENAQVYDYSYDKMNRLTGATYTSTNKNNHFNVSGITYDANGNIETLSRKQDGKDIDVLVYNYVNGNQLKGVIDNGLTTAVSDPSNPNITKVEDYGFYDDGDNDDFQYDLNGNMISDDNKGISSIFYNHLNLPVRIDFNDNTWVEYTYEASGTKLKKLTDTGASTDYITGIHYVDGALEFVHHSEGRALNSGSSFEYEYNLNDHLGNVRLSVDDLGAVVQRDDYYPYGLTFNSASTSPINLYGFSRKEIQSEMNWIHMGARMYDPAICRFNSIDSHSDFYEVVTPYNYAFNNPLLFKDPTGKDNTIYLVLAGNFDRKRAQAIADEANKLLKDFDLEISVKVFDPNESGEFDADNLDETDNWIAIGDDRKAVGKLANRIDKDWDTSNWIAGAKVGLSKKDSKKGAVFHVASNSSIEIGKTTEAEWAGIGVIHEAGHSSKVIQEEARRLDLDRYHLLEGIMMDGTNLIWNFNMNSPKNIFNKEMNKVFIDGMKERYSSEKAKDNYMENFLDRIFESLNPSSPLPTTDN